MYDLAALLGPTGTASTYELSKNVDPRSVRRWLTAGRLVRIHPGWVTLPHLAEDWTVRAHAATGYTGGVLSHRSALIAHGVLPDDAVHREVRMHVTVPADERCRSTQRLRIHRSRRHCGVSTVRGHATTGLPRALVDAWGDAHRSGASRRDADDARNAVLSAARDRLATVPAIERELAGVPTLPGRAALTELLGLVRDGVQSYLEIIGVRMLRSVRELPEPVLQYRMVLASGVVELDAAWPDVKLAVEFDGAAYHESREARQLDLRRDAALAALGWVVLRFSYADVTQRPTVCGAQVAAVHRQRRIVVPPADIPGQECPPAGRRSPGGG